MLTVGALCLVVRFQSGLPWLVLALSGVTLFVRFANAIYLFAIHRPYLRPSPAAFRAPLARRLLATGLAFLVVQLAALAMWQNDNILVAQLFGAAAVASYSVTFRLATTYVGLVSMWSASSLAALRGRGRAGRLRIDRASVRRTTPARDGGHGRRGGRRRGRGGTAIRIWTRFDGGAPVARAAYCDGRLHGDHGLVPGPRDGAQRAQPDPGGQMILPAWSRPR